MAFGIASPGMGALHFPAWLGDAALARCRQALASKLARETWKYSPLAKVTQALLNSPQALWTPLASVPKQVSMRRFSELPAAPDIHCDLERYPLAGIAAAKARNGWLIEVRSNPERPLRLNPAPAGAAEVVLLQVAPGCRLSIEQEEPANPSLDGEAAPGQQGAGSAPARELHSERRDSEAASAGRQTISAQVLLLSLARDAQAQWSHSTLAPECSNWSLLQARLADNATLDLHLHTAACAFRRLDLHVRLHGQGARFTSIGAALASAGAHLDQQLVVEHVGRNTYSRVKQHNLGMGAGGADAVPSSNGLSNATKARVNFNGRIHIHPGAAGADADLSNRNLALDRDAEINTKPELEIYNDDVRCAHGATVGQLDAQALFYLLSRGLPPSTAKGLLCMGFLRDALAGPFAAQTADALTARISLGDEA